VRCVCAVCALCVRCVCAVCAIRATPSLPSNHTALPTVGPSVPFVQDELRDARAMCTKLKAQVRVCLFWRPRL
jgi:hypothetical protein